MRDGHQRGVAQARTAPQDAAVGDRQQGLHDLVGAPAGVCPGVEPGVHAQAHDVEQGIAGDGCQQQHQTPGEQDAHLPDGDEDDHGVEEEEDGCRPQVALEDEQEQRHAGEDQRGRQQGDERRRPPAVRLPAGEGGQAFCQVSRQKGNQEQLERLGWLQVDPAAAQPHARTISERVGAEDDGQGGEQQAGKEPDVLVALQEGKVGRQAQPEGEDAKTEPDPQALAQSESRE